MKCFWLGSFIVMFVLTGYAKQDKKVIDPFVDCIPKKIEPSLNEEESKGEEEYGAEKVDFEIEVEGVVWNTTLPCAIIDGQLYKIGDEIQGGKIIDINKEGVSIMYKRRIYIFPVKKEAEK